MYIQQSKLNDLTFVVWGENRITVVFFAKEGKECNLTATKEDTLPSITFDFEKGLGQKFIQPSGTGIDLTVFEDSVLFKEAGTEIYPLAIKAEAALVVDSEEGKSSTNAEITQVAYVKQQGEIKIRVVKQILWVNGLRYEMEDIYGIGNTVDGCDEDASNQGKECVVCLSEPCDTTVLPCRHLVYIVHTFKRVQQNVKFFCVMDSEMVCVFLCAVYVQRMRKGVKVSDKSVSNLQTTCREAFGD